MPSGKGILCFCIVQRLPAAAHAVIQINHLRLFGDDLRHAGVGLGDGQLDGRACTVGHILLNAPQHILGMELLHRAIQAKTLAFQQLLGAGQINFAFKNNLHVPASTWQGCPCQYFCSTQETVVTS